MCRRSDGVGDRDLRLSTYSEPMSDHERSGGAPAWLVALLIVLASAGIATSITLLATRSNAPQDRGTGVVVSITASTSTSTSTSTIASTAPLADSTSTQTSQLPIGPAPDGGLLFGQPSYPMANSGDCAECGQDFLSSTCSIWTLRVTNSSNVAVSSFTFAAYGAEPRVIEARIEPYETQFVEFQTCKSAVYSDGPLFSAPSTIPFTWETGHVGSACFRTLSCS